MGALDCVPSGKMQATESTEVFSVCMSSNSTLNETRRDLESHAIKETDRRRHSIWWTLLIDVPLFVILIILLGLFEMGKMTTFKTGFYCRDPALSFPFRGDTVTIGALMATIFFGPFIIILGTELIFSDASYHRSKTMEAIRNTFWVYRSYLYGMLFNFVIVEVMKGITSSPRPTFFDICQPDTGLTCNGTEFVSSFQCTATNYSWWMQKDSYYSFPSGHASLSVYCALFVAWYLQKRAFDWQYRTVFVVPFLQLLGFTFAAISSLTRITDHRHHWWDVVTGLVIGFAFFIYAAMVLCKNFSALTDKHIEEPSPQPISRNIIFDTRRSDLPTP